MVPDLPDEGDCGSVLTHGSYSFVFISPNHKKHWELVDTVVHESVHVFQEAMKYAQEDNIGIETQAYQIAAIATNMLKDYNALANKRET